MKRLKQHLEIAREIANSGDIPYEIGMLMLISAERDDIDPLAFDVLRLLTAYSIGVAAAESKENI